MKRIGDNVKIFFCISYFKISKTLKKRFFSFSLIKESSHYHSRISPTVYQKKNLRREPTTFKM